MRHLLDNGIDINTADPQSGVTALHKASIHGDEAIVRLLLRSGANVDLSESKMGATPLHWAVLYGREHVARILLQHGADANRLSSNSGRTPLQMAAVARHGMETRWLQLEECRPRVNVPAVDAESFLEGLRESAENAVGAVVTTLLGNGAKTCARDNTGKTVLHLAIKHSGRWGYHETVMPKLLLDYGAELGVVDNLGWTELHSAALHGSTDIVRLLLERGADIENPNPTTPLHVAIHHGRLEVVKLLLEKGANVDVPNKNGRTPLHCAALGAPPELRRLLAPSTVDALQKEKEEMVRLLLGRRARIDAQDRKGKTALHHAVSVQDPVTISLLLENGTEANARIQDKKGRTPLQYAEEKGLKKVAKVLLDKEAKFLDF